MGGDQCLIPRWKENPGPTAGDRRWRHAGYRTRRHIISSQQIKVAEYSQNGSVDTVTQAYTQAGIFANYAGLLYDMQA